MARPRLAWREELARSEKRPYTVAPVTHAQMPGSDPVVRFVVQALKEERIDHTPAGIFNTPQRTVTGTLFELFCPVAAHLYDEQGNHTGPTADGSVEQGIPGVLYEVIGDAKYWFIPNDQKLRVELVGTGSGTMDLHVTSVANGEHVEKRVFNKVPVDPTMRAKVNADEKAQVHSLTIERSGERPQELKPHSTVRGKENLKRSAPAVVSASISGQAGPNGWYTGDVSVTLTAADRGQGVVSIIYKREGDALFQPYNGPVPVSEEGSTVLLAGATDGLGQDQPRATRVTIRIDKTSPATEARANGGTLVLTAVDSGSGVDVVEYSRDDGRTWENYLGNLRFDVQTKVLYRARDLAGNIESPREIIVRP